MRRPKNSTRSRLFISGFDISLEDLSDFYSYDQLKSDITIGREVVEHTEKISEIKEFTDKNLLN